MEGFEEGRRSNNFQAEYNIWPKERYKEEDTKQPTSPLKGCNPTKKTYRKSMVRSTSSTRELKLKKEYTFGRRSSRSRAWTIKYSGFVMYGMVCSYMWNLRNNGRHHGSISKLFWHKFKSSLCKLHLPTAIEHLLLIIIKQVPSFKLSLLLKNYLQDTQNSTAKLNWKLFTK